MPHDCVSTIMSPDAVDELNDCVTALAKNNKHWAAHVLAMRGLAIDQSKAALWANLGGAFYGLREFEKAEGATMAALERAPGHPSALGNLALIYEATGRADLAAKTIDEAYFSTPNDREIVRWNRALMYLRQADYDRGLRDYEARIVGNGYARPPAPEWRGEDLQGKTIYVDIEQGVGDVIMLSRFLPWLAKWAGRVMLRTTPIVAPLLTEYPVELVDGPIDYADYGTYLGSLPYRYGLRPDGVPPPTDHIRRAVMKSPPMDFQQPNTEGALKVGICWACNPDGERPQERSVPLEKVGLLAYNPRVWLYSLQCREAAGDIARLGASNFILDFSGRLDAGGFLATGRAILNCDLVVTCCTSVAHLAATLGVPTLVMLAIDPYWPWFLDGRDVSPWYPAARLFRQQVLGQWDEVIMQIYEAITQWR